MKNKVLVKLIVPEVNASFDLFVPVNELIWKIKKMALKSIGDLVQIHLNPNKEYILLNKENCLVYGNNDFVIQTDIRNGTELFLISV